MVIDAFVACKAEEHAQYLLDNLLWNCNCYLARIVCNRVLMTHVCNLVVDDGKLLHPLPSWKLEPIEAPRGPPRQLV